MGAMMGQLTNIDELGQASMGFHGDPALMQHDPYRWAQHCPVEQLASNRRRRCNALKRNPPSESKRMLLNDCSCRFKAACYLKRWPIPVWRYLHLQLRALEMHSSKPTGDFSRRSMCSKYMVTGYATQCYSLNA